MLRGNEALARKQILKGNEALARQQVEKALDFYTEWFKR
jgi:hypothetical protein